MNIVGMGGAGCNIARQFEKYPQYNVYYVDAGLGKSKNSFSLTKRDTHEEYDKRQIRMSKFVESMSDSSECLFVMAGSGNVSGASLQVLKFLNRKFEVSVLYIKPDYELLGKTAYLQDRICYNILQEYARSGVFNNLCLVSNDFLEEILQESLTSDNYFDMINELISYTVHMMNVFKNTEPVLNNFTKTGEHERISTIGLVDFDSGEEKVFFPLDNPANKCYYYAVASEELEKDFRLLKSVNRQIKNKLPTDVEAGYQIHSTKYEKNFAFTEIWTSQIQNYPEGQDG